MAITAESIFREFFLPLYPADVVSNLAASRLVDANPAKNKAIYAHVTDAANIFTEMAHGVFLRDLELDYSDASVHRLSATIDRTRRDSWMTEGKAGTSDNLLFNIVVHGAAYVGECIARSRGGVWSIRRPLWESVVHLTSPAGEGDLAVFHWWLKSLADDAFAKDGTPRSGIGERYRTHVEMAFAPKDLSPLVAGERALPRIAKSVRYDVLYKYIKAHLPEIRDFGTDFPSPERFDAYKFAWLDFRLVGDGRMLVIFGRGEGGLHVFWMTKDGFVKSALFASEAAPEPSVDSTGDVLKIHVTMKGKPNTHEVLWWGP